MKPASHRTTHRRPGPGPIDYLILGHVTLDQGQPGPRVGGTAAYAGLTALSLGLRVGIVTACRADLDLSELSGLTIERQISQSNTLFQNLGQGSQRHQIMTARADDLEWGSIPAAWRGAPIVHLAPVANEVDPAWAASFPGAFVGLTPQGWWRTWDQSGRVSLLAAQAAQDRLPHANAAVFSRQDVLADSAGLGQLGRICQVTGITNGPDGSDIVWGLDAEHLQAPASRLVDDTGAGDIFAARFFIDLASGSAPLEAGRAATQLASASVEHSGLDGARLSGRDRAIEGMGRL
jgi:sugar/nucleoside kinase (ribokinase family)